MRGGYVVGVVAGMVDENSEAQGKYHHNLVSEYDAGAVNNIALQQLKLSKSMQIIQSTRQERRDN